MSQARYEARSCDFALRDRHRDRQAASWCLKYVSLYALLIPDWQGTVHVLRHPEVRIPGSKTSSIHDWLKQRHAAIYAWPRMCEDRDRELEKTRRGGGTEHDIRVRDGGAAVSAR